MQAAKKEILRALKGMLASTIPVRDDLVNGTVLVGSAPALTGLPKQIQPDLDKAGPEGFVVSTLTSQVRNIPSLRGTQRSAPYMVFSSSSGYCKQGNPLNACTSSLHPG
jgi:hypothetical protein